MGKKEKEEKARRRERAQIKLSIKALRAKAEELKKSGEEDFIEHLRLRTQAGAKITKAQEIEERLGRAERRSNPAVMINKIIREQDNLDLEQTRFHDIETDPMYIRPDPRTRSEGGLD